MLDSSSKPQKLILYSFYRSSATWRVRIVLNYKDISYQMKFLHLFKGEQSSEEFKKINPNGVCFFIIFQAIPALILPNNKGTLIQSVAICEYLEETNSASPLLPKDPIKKAQIRGFCEYINSGIQPYQNLRMINKVHEQFGAQKKEFALEWIERGMVVLEQMLSKTKGKYCFGDDVTLADAFFVPHVQGGITRFGLQIQKYPQSKQVLQNLSKVQAFIKAKPQSQPDFQQQI